MRPRRFSAEMRPYSRGLLLPALCLYLYLYLLLSLCLDWFLRTDLDYFLSRTRTRTCIQEVVHGMVALVRLPVTIGEAVGPHESLLLTLCDG